MTLTIHNTLRRRKEPFRPIEPGRIRMYVCGITVYDLCHLGHARVLVCFDAIVRYLRSRGWDVTYVRNITDIDDKILNRAADNGEPFTALTARMIEAMHQDERALGVLPPDLEPRATEHIEDIQDMVATLIDNHYAYLAANGDVYYRVKRFPEYGKLSGKNPDELLAGARIDPDEAKEDPRDFALWKAAAADEVGAPVLGPGGLRLALDEGPFLAVGERRDPARVDAERDEVVARGVRALVAQGHVVLVGAPLVAMALDLDLHGGPLLQPLGVRGHGVPLVGPDVVEVVVEEDVLEVALLVELLEVCGKRFGDRLRDGRGDRLLDRDGDGGRSRFDLHFRGRGRSGLLRAAARSHEKAGGEDQSQRSERLRHHDEPPMRKRRVEPFLFPAILSVDAGSDNTFRPATPWSVPRRDSRCSRPPSGP